MDLIGNAVRFGTSESSNYGLSQDVASKMAEWSRNPYQLIDDTLDGIAEAIKLAKDELITNITNIFNKATAAANELSDSSDVSDKEAATKAAESEKSMGMDFINGLYDLVKDGISEVVKASVLKYRVEVMGIVNALTGNPSTPWHISVGNPLRPTFCAGDMYTTNVSLKLGPNLAFNDLPSSITVEFTLTNARPWGLQEIMAKFNSGYLRTVDTQRTFFETTIEFKGDNLTSKEVPGALLGDKEGWATIPPPAPPVAPANSGTVSVSQGGGNTPTGGGGTVSTATGGTVSTATNNGPTNVVVPGQNATGSTVSTASDQQSKTTGGQASP